MASGYPGYGAEMAAGYGAPAAAPAAAQGAADPYAAYAPQPAYAAAPGASYAAPAPSYGAYGHPDEIRTVFITGFPADVKERELNNMLRFLPGYEASQMHWKNGQAQGFALFDTGHGARNAMNSIHNLVFDDNAVLRCELARKNMYLKEDATVKRGRFEAPPPHAAYYGAPAAGYYPPAPAAATGPRAYVPVSNTRDNPPCNTLFVGNLGDTVREEELRALFGSQPGFRQLKITRGGKAVTAFVEFGDIPSAMHVHQTQQGAVLQSSERGGIRIQYSKNPFGRKRDYNGNYVSEMEHEGASGQAGGGDSAAPGEHYAQQPAEYAQQAAPAQAAAAEQPYQAPFAGAAEEPAAAEPAA